MAILSIHSVGYALKTVYNYSIRKRPGKDGHEESLTVSHLDGGPPCFRGNLPPLACEAPVLGLVEDEEGEPLSIGRRSRSIPPSLKRALRARDPHCRFPGCTRTAYLDGYHITQWADGGETSLDNLVHLCRHHHRLVHEGAFSCEKGATGELVFRDERDEHLPHYCHLTPEDERREFDAWLAAEMREFHITPTTCVTRWQGEAIDRDLAVGHLFPYTPDRAFPDTSPQV